MIIIIHDGVKINIDIHERSYKLQQFVVQSGNELLSTETILGEQSTL